MLALGLILLPSLPSCLHLRETLERPVSLDLPLAGPGPEQITAEANRISSVGVWLLTLGGLAYGLGRWRRAWREAGKATPLDREDLALLRTARDALSYLARKQAGRLRVVSLALRRGRRKP
ncbi:MAG: hypothetical protein V1806_12245 [Pseudomonadota bacterium]